MGDPSVLVPELLRDAVERLAPHVSGDALRWAFGLLALAWLGRRAGLWSRGRALLGPWVEPWTERARLAVAVKQAARRGDWVAAGWLHERRGELLEALDCFEKAEEYHLCGEICLRLGRKDYAAEWFVLADEKKRAASLYEAIGRHGRAAELYLEMGAPLDAAAAYARAGEHLRAAELYEKAEQFLRAAEELETAGALDRAAACFVRQLDELGLGRAPLPSERAERARLAHRAAGCFERSGRPAEAAAVLEKAGLLAPAAEIYERIGEIRRAAELFEKAGDTVRAARLYEAAGEKSRAAALEGEARLSRGEAEAAAEAFLASNDAMRAAEIFESAGRFDRAADCYEALEAYRPAAEAALRHGDVERAAVLFDKAGLAEQAAELWTRLGLFDKAAEGFARAGRFFDAAKAASEANAEAAMVDYLQRVPPDDPHYRCAAVQLARVFRRRGWASLAVEKLEPLAGDEPVRTETTELWDELARAYEADGRLERAAEILRRILAARYGYGDVAERLAALEERIAEEKRRESTFRLAPVAAPAPALGGWNGDRYRIEAMLGRGGMGAVYKAYDRLLERPVAYKVLTEADGRGLDRLLAEARAAAALNHPNIITVFDLGLREDGAFISMELVEGENYATRLRNRGPLPLDELMHFLVSVCQGLDHAHHRGIVHQDLKPSNVLLTVDGRVKIVDFGLAQAIDAAKAMGHNGSISGTPKYIAPEQARGEPTDARSDIYSLGASLYELAVGAPPFTEGNLLYHHLHTPPPPLRSRRADVPPALEELVLLCLAKHRQERFQSAGEIVSFAAAAKLL